MISALVRRIQLDRPKDSQERIIKAINSLNDREKELLSLRFPWTLVEVAKKWGITKQRVKEIEARAVDKIVLKI